MQKRRRIIAYDILFDKSLTDDEKRILLKDHYEKLEKKRKYRKGEAILDIDTLLKQVFVNIFYTTRHIEFVKSLQLRVVLNLIKDKQIFYAIKKENLENE